MGVRAQPRRRQASTITSTLLLEHDDSSDDDIKYYEGAMVPASSTAQRLTFGGEKADVKVFSSTTHPYKASLSKEAEIFLGVKQDKLSSDMTSSSQVDGRRTCDV